METEHSECKTGESKEESLSAENEDQSANASASSKINLLEPFIWKVSKE